MALSQATPIIGRLARRIAFDTPNAFTGINIGLIPAGATPTGVYADMDPAWLFDNSATANLGFSAGGGEWATALNIAAAGRRFGTNYVGIAALPLAADRQVWVRIQGTPSNPTRGWALFVVEYVW